MIPPASPHSEAAATSGSSASANSGAAAPAHDLFAALLALLDALPIPVTPPAPLPERVAEGAPEGEERAAIAAAAWAALAPMPAVDALPAMQAGAPALEARGATARALVLGSGSHGLLEATPPVEAPAAVASPAPQSVSPTTIREGKFSTQQPALAESQPSAQPPQAFHAAPAPPVAAPPRAAAERPPAEAERTGALASPRGSESAGALLGDSSARSAAPLTSSAPSHARHEPGPIDAPHASALRADDPRGVLPHASPQLSASPLGAAPEPSAENARPLAANALWLAEQGGGRARLTLSPPELGSVEIVVRVRGRRVDVQLRVEESAAAQAVRDTRQQLVDALASRDLRVDELSVDTNGARSAGGDSRDARREDAPLREQPAPPGDGAHALARAPGPRVTPAASVRSARGEIDLRV